MDQLKDILKQAIKYRFWIAVGISAILPIIAYAAGAGAIQQKAQEETTKIVEADKDVRQYSSGTVPNADYKPLVEQKKDELVKDINASWKKLYARQAPLLTWPKNVEERFRTWERKWPENVDASAVQLAIIEYVTAYRGFVTDVYKIFQPFDLAEGTGIVSAPPEETLLHPFPFTIENPPELGKVWAAQERLWTQRTILEVIAEVNKDAKDWNTAAIKQINLLEVGNAVAQDQKSIAKGETLTEAPAITAPAAGAPAAAPAPVADPNNPDAPPMESPPMDAPPMEAPPDQPPTDTATQQLDPDSVYYINNPSTQFKVLPFELSVLIEQDRIQDLLVALENSPMAIQVMEFEMSKPSTRVTKPVKGQSLNYAEYSGTPMGMPMPMAMPGRPMFQTFGGPRMGTTGPSARPSVDARGRSRADLRKAEEQAVLSNTTGFTIHDPYYNIIEVTVYGQARFYNPPPVEPAPAPSVSESAPAPATPEGTPPATEAPQPEGTPPATEAPKAEGTPPATEAPKAEGETPKAEGEAPKGEAPKEAAPTPTAPANGELPQS